MNSSRQNNNSLMKRELQLMLAQGSPRIALAENTMRRRSCIWNYYKRVLLDGDDQPFASCNHCDTLVHYSSKHGTGSLLRHKCNTYPATLQYATGTEQPGIHPPIQQQPSSSGAGGRRQNIGEINGLTQPRNGRSSKTAANRRGGGRVMKVEPPAPLPPPPPLPVVNAVTTRRSYSLMTPAPIVAPSVGFDEHLLQVLAEKQVAFIAKDLRPIDTTDGAGFLELAQALMEVAASESGGGPVVPVVDVLAAQPLLAAVYLPRMCERVRAGLVVDVLATRRPALALDVWRNDAGRRFVTLTVTYVTDDFEMRSAVLGTRDLAVVEATVAPLGGAERKFQVKTEEGAAVVRAMLDIVSEYTGSVDSATEKLAASALVTDDSALYAALDDATPTRLLCPCHALNSILDSVLAPTSPGASPSWRQFCRDVDSLTEYLRRSGVTEHPLRPLAERPAIVTWCDVYETLVQLREAYPQLLPLLAEAGEAGRLRRLPEPVLDVVIDFLDLFKECLESLCVDSYPTLNECVLWKLKLDKHCVRSCDPARSGTLDEFPGWLLDVQNVVRDKLHHSLNLDKLCSVALLLDPNFKSLRMLSEADRKWAKEVAMNLMRESIPATSGSGEWRELGAHRAGRFRDNAALGRAGMKSDSPRHHLWPGGRHKASASSHAAAESTACEPPPSKRARSLLNFTEFLQPAGEDDPSVEDPAETELRRYVELRVAGEQLGDVLQFWKSECADQFPLLRQLAKWVLAIPACSSVKHCPFSSAGRVLERRRALNSCVDQIVFLHKNLTM